MVKFNVTYCSRFNSYDIPLFSLPRIVYEFIRNGLIAGFGKIYSLRLLIQNNGKLDIGKQLFVNLFTNTLNALYSDYTYLHIERGGELHIKDVAYIASGCKITVLGSMYIGSETFINARTSIICTNRVTIGSSCAISWDVSIIDTDVHHVTDTGGQRVGENNKPITIGNHVWVGAGVKILKGVTIGDNVIIAAGSIVTQDIPAGTLAGGVPAKILKHEISWK